MVEEQRREGNGKHDGHEEEEEDVEPRHFSVRTRRPEFDEILNRSASNIETITQGVEKKQNEEFVRVETDAIVHPWTVVIHLEDADATDTAMMSAIRFHAFALLAIPNTTGNGSVVDGKILGKVSENLLLHFLRLLSLQSSRSLDVHEENLRNPSSLRENSLCIGPGEHEENAVIED